MPQVNLSFIKHKRQEKDLTQDDVAKALGTTRILYNRRELGVVAFKAIEIPVLAKILDVDISALYK